MLQSVCSFMLDLKLSNVKFVKRSLDFRLLLVALATEIRSFDDDGNLGGQIACVNTTLKHLD